MGNHKLKRDVAWFFVILCLSVLILMSALSPETRNTAVFPLSANDATNAVIATLQGNSGLPAYKSLEEFPPYDWPATETAWVVTQVAFRTTLEYDQTHQPTRVEPTLISGIINGVGSIWSDTAYELENSWQGQMNGMRLGVIAGAYRADPTLGIVVMGWEEVYEAPVKAGSLHIIAEQNYCLTLLSTDGTSFNFDILGRRFVESLTEIVPTITPITPSPTNPSPTPTITPTFNPTWLTPWPTCTPIPPSTATREPCGP